MGIPAPWAGSARADVQYELHLALKMTNALDSADRVPVGVRQCSAANLQALWLQQQGGNMPVFVVNLDKRTDR